MTQLVLDTLKQAFMCDLHDHVKFYIENQHVGYIHTPLSDYFKNSFPDIFFIKNNFLHLKNDLKTPEDRMHSIDYVIKTAVEQKILPKNPFGPHNPDPHFQTNERLPVFTNNRHTPLTFISRFYAGYLGIKINAVCAHIYNQKGYWLATRGQNVDFSGLYDSSIAGGWDTQSITADNCLSKEAQEEANVDTNIIPPISIKRLKTFNKTYSQGRYINEDTFISDMRAPEDFIPIASNPGEISEFNLLPFSQLIDLLITSDNFSPVSRILITDFAIRHNHATADNFPDFHAIKDILNERTNTTLANWT